MGTVVTRGIALAVLIGSAVTLAIGCSSAPPPSPTSAPKADAAVPTKAAAAAQPAAAAKRTIKFGHIQTVNDPIHKGVEKFAELVAKNSDGQLEVKIYPSSQLGDAPSQMDGVKMGTQEMFVDGVPWFEQWDKDFGIFGTLDAFRDQDHLVKVMASPVGQELLEKVRKEQGVRTVAVNWYRPPRDVFSKKAVKTGADLKGLKIRVPENKVWVESWKAVGTTPTPVAWGETFTALQQGVVDAMEGPITMVYTMKFHEVAKFATLTHSTRTVSTPVINEKFFQSLSPALQKVVTDAAAQAGETNNELQYAGEKDFLDKMKKEGVTFIEPDPQMFAAAKDAITQFEESGMWRKGLYKQFQDVK